MKYAHIVRIKTDNKGIWNRSWRAVLNAIEEGAADHALYIGVDVDGGVGYHHPRLNVYVIREGFKTLTVAIRNTNGVTRTGTLRVHVPVEANTLEYLFGMFNGIYPLSVLSDWEYMGPSLSVGESIQIFNEEDDTSTVYRCEEQGWTIIEPVNG